MKSQLAPLATTCRIAGVLCLLTLLFLSVPVFAQEGEVPAEAPAEEVPIKKIKMYAENWKWTPNVIRVEHGTKLIITTESFDAPHSFLLKAYGLKVRLPEGETTTFEFVADKTGEFPWRCGRPCGNGCPKMRGKLIVAEATETAEAGE